ncbi:hypothetical protein BJ741DRAFT_362469 [Chytriomyces cf. hyalinus JEL632]|nr:hypothetical protein BJ741DRAFT_362469 [Chytriomyces cf. hyalinus JEL632]
MHAQTVLLVLAIAFACIIDASTCTLKIMTTLAFIAVGISVWSLHGIMAQFQNKQHMQAFGVTHALCAISADQNSLRAVNTDQWKVLCAIWGDGKYNREKVNRDLLNFHQRLQAAEAKLVNTETNKPRRQLLRRQVFIHVRPSLKSSGKAVDGSCCACTSLTKAVTAGAGTDATSPPATATPSPSSPAAAATTSQPPTNIAAAAEPVVGLINRGSAAAAPPSTATSPSDKQTASTSPQPPTPLQSTPRSRIPVPDNAKSSPLPKRVLCSVKPSPRSVKASSTCRTTPASTSTPSRPPRLANTLPTNYTSTTHIKRTEAAHPVDLISRASAASVLSPVTPPPSTPAMPPTSNPPPPSSEANEIASQVPLPPPDKEEEAFFAASHESPLTQPTSTQAHLESNEANGAVQESTTVIFFSPLFVVYIDTAFYFRGTRRNATRFSKQWHSSASS